MSQSFAIFITAVIHIPICKPLSDLDQFENYDHPEHHDDGPDNRSSRVDSGETYQDVGMALP